MRLSELLKHLPPGVVISLTGDAQITAPVVESSREVESGGLFVARAGGSVDGHRFIPDAIQRGAAAVVGSQALLDLPVPYVRLEDPQAALGHLAAAYYDNPSHRMTVMGVTGTNGKTTTTTLLHSILKQHVRTGYISTIAADLGDQTADTGLHVTTPHAPDVQKYLAQMVQNGLTHCVLEMTSHGLAQGRLNGVAVDVAVLTNITHEHLDYHGTFENYRAAKGRMFQMLGQSTPKPKNLQPKISIINADDPNADFFAAFPADKVVRYGFADDADVKVVDVAYAPDETRITLDVSHQVEVFVTKLVGRFNVMNITAAVAATHALNIPMAVIRRGIAEVEAVSGRMERVDEGQNFLAVVDFAHTPDALENALNAARLMTKGRLIVVFGCAGLRDVEKRRMMPEIAARLADFTVMTAEDPRTESLDAILQTMADAHGGIEGKSYIRVADRGEALYQACQMAQPGDVVMACGKGHEQSMCFGTIEYPWDDREAMRAALRGAPLRTLPTALS